MTEQTPPAEPHRRPAEGGPASDADTDATATAPHRPLPPQSATPPPAAAAPFPLVLKTPWVNPARRRHVVLTSVLALIVVAVAAFLAGLAVGDHDHRDRGEVPIVCPMVRPGMHGPVMCIGRGTPCGPHQGCRDERMVPPGRQRHAPPSPAPSAPSSSSRSR